MTIALPNCPQALYCLYAVNHLGAIANMLHPLSSEQEIFDSVSISGSKVAISIDQAQSKFVRCIEDGPLCHLVVTSPVDCASALVRFAYRLQRAKNTFRKVPSAVKWADMMALAGGAPKDVDGHPASGDPAVILYSGGTTGITKGVLHSNRSINHTVR